jgi:hypothetical protein
MLCFRVNTMKLTALFLVCFIFSIVALAQSNKGCQPLPYLDTCFKNWQTGQTPKSINLADSLLNHLAAAFVKYEYDDTTEHQDSNFYASNYITGADTFRFVFKTLNQHYPDGNHAIDNNYIFLTILVGNKTLLPQNEIYSRHYTESYGEENHCFMVDDNGDKIPDLLFVSYTYLTTRENDELDCKSCSLVHLMADDFESFGIRNCDKLLLKHAVPYVLR